MSDLSMTAWQPIETAPKDGTPILVCEGKEIWVAVYRVPSGGTAYKWFCPYNFTPVCPTHWMPLPPPPAPAESGEEQEPLGFGIGRHLMGKASPPDIDGRAEIERLGNQVDDLLFEAARLREALELIASMRDSDLDTPASIARAALKKG